MTQDANGNGYYAGDATPEDIPNPDTQVFPGDEREVPGNEHASTSFGFADNQALVQPTKHARKDASAYNEQDVRIRDESYIPGQDVVHAVANVQELAARTFNAFTVNAIPSDGTFYVGNPTQLVGDDPGRQKVTISNAHDTDSVLLGALDQISAGGGFTLTPLTTFTAEVQGAIYAAVPAAGLNVIPVGVWVERNV